MAQADSIVVLDNGKIVHVCSPQSLLQNHPGTVGVVGPSAPRLTINESTAEHRQPDIGAEQDQSRLDPGLEAPARQPLDVDGTEDDNENNVSLDIRRKHGELSVYTYYLASSGYAAVALYGVTMALWIFCTEFSSKCFSVTLSTLRVRGLTIEASHLGELVVDGKRHNSQPASGHVHGSVRHAGRNGDCCRVFGCLVSFLTPGGRSNC